MAQLPAHGQDPWDETFNGWLLVSRNADGTLRADAIQQALGRLLPAILVWSDALGDYDPPELKASSSPKEFRGPVDPSTVPGVVLNPRDIWDAMP